MSQPANGTRDGEQHGEHRHRKPERLVDEAGVEVDVRIQLALDEVRVAEGGLFQLQRNVEQRVLAGDLEHVVGRLLDDGGTRVEVLVHAVAEAHQAGSVAALHVFDEGRYVFDAADLGEHAHDGFVGASVQRAVKGRSCGRGRRVRVGVAGANDAHGGGAAVLLMVGMEDEQHVHRPLEARVDFVVADAPHHVEEVARERQRVVGVYERQADREAVAHGCERGHLRDQAQDLLVAAVLVVDVFGVVVERAERTHCAHEHAHRVCVIVESVDEALAHVLVDERVMDDVVVPLRQLRSVGQLAVQQQVRHFQVGALLRQLLDGVAAVAQDALLTIEVRDRTLAGRSLHVGRVVDEERRIEFSNCRRRKDAAFDGDGDCLPSAIVGDGDGVGHVVPLDDTESLARAFVPRRLRLAARGRQRPNRQRDPPRR